MRHCSKIFPSIFLILTATNILTSEDFISISKNDIPAIFGETAFDICKSIENGDTADAEKINTFKNDYVNKRFDSITSVYGEIIDSLIKGTYDGKYNYKG